MLYLPDKKKQTFACLSNCRYCANRAQNLTGPARNDVLTVLQISTKSVHFRRSNSQTRQLRFFARERPIRVEMANVRRSDIKAKIFRCPMFSCLPELECNADTLTV